MTKCQWCHKTIGKRIGKKYCDVSCAAIFGRVKNRIFNIFPFEAEKAAKEIQRLEKMGKNYTFPHPHEALNLLYNLRGDNKHD